MISAGMEHETVKTNLKFGKGRAKTEVQGDFIGYYMDDVIIFETDGLETVKLRVFRPLGYVLREGLGFKSGLLPLQPEFRDFYCFT